MGVKLHNFEPSDRKVWTVVGKENEHWLDPEIPFCSCADYYFKAMGSGAECYHLKALRAARESGRVETVIFSDSEYQNFIAAVIKDLIEEQD